MEPMVVYPETPEQQHAIEAFLNDLHVGFESQKGELPPHVLKGIERSTEQYLNGQTISLEQFKAKYLYKK